MQLENLCQKLQLKFLPVVENGSQQNFEEHFFQIRLEMADAVLRASREDLPLLIQTRSFRTLGQAKFRQVPLSVEEIAYKDFLMKVIEGAEASYDFNLLRQSLYAFSVMGQPWHLPLSISSPSLALIFTDPILFNFFASFPHFYFESQEGERNVDFLNFLLDAFTHILASSDVTAEARSQMIGNFLRFFRGIPFLGNSRSLREPLEKMRKLVASFFQLPPYIGSPHKEGVFRVGLLRVDVGGDFRFTSRAFLNLNPKKYQVTFYTLLPAALDELSKHYPHIQFKNLPSPNSWQDCVSFLRQEKLDIFINASFLGSSVAGVQPLILSARVAPLQLMHHSDIYTSGLETMDYFLMGENLAVDGIETEFSEKIWKLPGIACHFDADFHGKTPLDEKQRLRRELGIPLEDLVLVSNAHIFKLVPELLETWVKILSALPGSRLVLMPEHQANLSIELFLLQQLLEKFCQTHGVDRNRIHLLKAQGREAVGNRLSTADLYLDSFPYCGSASTSEAFSRALPSVTLRGNVFRTRLVAKIFEEFGLGDFVAEDVNDYIEKVVSLARSPSKREAFEARLVSNYSKSRYLDPAWAGAVMEEAFDRLLRAPSS